MLETAPSASDWDRLTLTIRGAAIEKVLRPFFLKPLALEAPLGDLEDRVALVLDGLERPRTRIAKVSSSLAFEGLSRRDEDEREEYVSGLLSLVARPLVRPIHDLLREAFLADVAAECGSRKNLGVLVSAVGNAVAEPPCDDPDMRLAKALHAVPAGLIATMFYLAAATAYDLTAEPTARELARLYLDGNFPVGIQHDGAFVVLVR